MIGVGVRIYVYICVWGQKKLDHTLVIDYPFQTFARAEETSLALDIFMQVKKKAVTHNKAAVKISPPTARQV